MTKESAEAEAPAETEAGEELQAAWHQLALAQAEGHQARQEAAQLRQALDDQRHENRILADEIHRQNSLETVRAGLEGELEETRAVVEQLQRQLTELQTSDTVQHDQLLARQLLARQQHDATMRTLMERQAKETAALRAAADTARGRAEQLEMENGRLGTRLTAALEEVGRLQAELGQAEREAAGGRAAHEAEEARGTCLELEEVVSYCGVTEESLAAEASLPEGQEEQATSMLMEEAVITCCGVEEESLAGEGMEEQAKAAVERKDFTRDIYLYFCNMIRVYTGEMVVGFNIQRPPPIDKSRFQMAEETYEDNPYIQEYPDI